MFGILGLLGAILASSPVTDLFVPGEAFVSQTPAPLPAGATLRQEFELLNRRLCRVRTFDAEGGAELRVEFFRPEDELFDYCVDSAAGLIPVEIGTSPAAGVASIASPVGHAAQLAGAGAVLVGIQSLGGRSQVMRPQSR